MYIRNQPQRRSLKTDLTQHVCNTTPLEVNEVLMPVFLLLTVKQNTGLGKRSDYYTNLLQKTEFCRHVVFMFISPFGEAQKLQNRALFLKLTTASVFMTQFWAQFSERLRTGFLHPVLCCCPTGT